MSEIKALEKMREWAKKYRPMGSYDPLMFADEIQAEVDNRFIELPTDRNGQPWHIGEHIHNVGAVNQMRLNKNGWLFMESGALEPDKCEHAKHRSIEDVLNDFGPLWVDTYSPSDRVKLVTRCADEIRELMEGDE